MSGITLTCHVSLIACPWVLAASLGCQAQRAPALLVETSARFYDSKGAQVLDREKAFRAGASSLLRILPGRMVVESSAVVMEQQSPNPSEGGASTEPQSPPQTARRSTSVKFFDFDGEIVWTSTDGSPFEPEGLNEVVYNEANALRRKKLEFVNAYVFSPTVRGLANSGLYLGDLSVSETRQKESFAGKEAHRRKVAAEPGSFWEVLVSSDASLFTSSWGGEHYLVGSMAVSAPRARELLKKIGGAPVTVTVWSFLDGESLPSMESSLIRYEEVMETTPWKGPSALEVEQARRLNEKLKDPRALLEALRKRLNEEDSAPPSKIGLFLRLGARMRSEHLPEVLRLLGEAQDPLSQVELARAAIRFDPKAAWPGLRAIIRGKEGARAMNVAEALIAEGSEKAMASMFHILLERNAYTDVDREAVALWGVQHLAVLHVERPGSRGGPRASLDELAALFNPGGGNEAQDAGAFLARELDYWLRWWEKVKASYPPL